MLWGQRINVYNDHKNLTRDGLGLTTDRVARWRILLEEYAPEIIYIKRDPYYRRGCNLPTRL